jgi:DNA-binding SARP family transcriptional activator
MLLVEPIELDAARFERLASEGRNELEAGNAARADTVLSEALALWRGLPLADLIDEPFALAEQRVLLDRQLAAHEDLIDAELALGYHVRVLGEIEARVEEQPYDERLAAQLLLALYEPAGRRTRSKLRCRELSTGVGPGPARLRGRQRDILNHDPALLLARPSPARGPQDGDGALSGLGSHWGR